MESLEKWQNLWDKKFESVRLRWLNSLSPNVFEFFKNIKWIHGSHSTWGETEYILYFKSFYGNLGERVFRFSVYEKFKESDRFKLTFDYGYKLIVYNNPYDIEIRRPFEKSDADIVIPFLKDLLESVKEAAKEIKKEHDNLTASHIAKNFVGLSIEDYDKENMTFLLSNGETIQAHDIFRKLKDEMEKSLLKNKEEEELYF